MLDKLKEIQKRFETVEAEYNDPNIVTNPKELQRVGKLRSDLEPVVQVIREYDITKQALCDAEEMLDDPE